MKSALPGSAIGNARRAWGMIDVDNREGTLWLPG